MSEQDLVEADQQAQVHRDSLADTDDAYTPFHGWVLACCWCDFTAWGANKRSALALMQDHYDRVIPEGATIRG